MSGAGGGRAVKAQLHHFTRMVALAVVYVAAARFGLTLQAVHGFATLVWLPTGISLAALLCFGHRIWPGVAVGALVANVLTGAPVAVALGIALGNTLEALAGAYALRKIPGFTRSLERLPDVFGLVFLAAMGSTAISATIGVYSLLLGGIVVPEHFGETWRAWWVGDLIADLVVAPLLLAWSAPPRVVQPPQRLPELAAMATTLVAFTVLIYGGPPAGEDNFSILRHSYMFFPLLIWASLRFGQRWAITTTFVVTVIAVAGTALGHGPFVQSSLYRSLFGLQTFMAIAAATFLVLGASMAERRQAAHQLKDAVDARDALISVASHELKTPLSALHLQLHLIGRKITSAAVDDATLGALSSRITGIDRQVARLGRLIDNLLDVSRINAGKIQLEYDDLDLVEVVREVVGRFEEELSSGGPPVELRAGAAVSGRWDRMRVDQVVTNLVSNALKYGKNTAVEITVEASEDPSMARIEVRDHGMGIAESDLARIFERFERLVSGKQAGGFGLGLWIVREIVQALGGTISVWSRPGEGTSFTVDLPRKPQAEDAASSASLPRIPLTTGKSSQTERANRRVLVVEDDPDILDAVSEVLRAEGYSVSCAENGQKAMDYLHRERPPCVILLDLAMPVMDGKQFLDAKGRTSTLATIPVVLLSAAGQLESKAQDLQVAGYLQKPVKLETLISTIERHCHRGG